jgi:hypothetical protein
MEDQCEHCPHKQEIFGKLSGDRSASNFRRYQKAFNGFDSLTNVYVSPWLQKEAALSPILKDSRGLVILNPIDTSIFNPSANQNLPIALHNQKYVFLPIELN